MLIFHANKVEDEQKTTVSFKKDKDKKTPSLTKREVKVRLGMVCVRLWICPPQDVFWALFPVGASVEIITLYCV